MYIFTYWTAYLKSQIPGSANLVKWEVVYDKTAYFDILILFLLVNFSLCRNMIHINIAYVDEFSIQMA